MPLSVSYVKRLAEKKHQQQHQLLATDAKPTRHTHTQHFQFSTSCFSVGRKPVMSFLSFFIDTSLENKNFLIF
jgi:hypothetical protein